MTVFSKLVKAECSETIHPWSTSCSFVALEVFYYIFRSSFKIYGTLYLIATLLRRKGWEYVKKELLYEVLRSSVFLSTNGSLFVGFICLLRKLLGTFTFLTGGLIPALLASSIAILVERPQRRGLLALHMFNNAIEVIFNSLVSRSIVRTMSYGEVYMFCTATGLLMYLYRANKLNNGFINKTIKFLLGEENSNGNAKSGNAASSENLYSSIGRHEDTFRRLISPAKAFSIGYLIEAVPGILKSIFQPMKIPLILVRKNNFKLGLFLGSFVSIFKFVEYLSTLLREKDDSLNSLVAGGASGLSMLFYRSSSISLYSFTKVAEILIKNAQYEGLLPFIPYADIIIYAISTAVVFHTCVFEVQNVKPGYWKFLSHITNNKIEPASKIFPQLFGTKGPKT